MAYATSSGSAPRILVIEDREEDAFLIRRYWRKVYPDQEALFARSLREAIDVLSEHPIDLALLDLGLPDTAGTDGITQLHEVYPMLPIVVLTGREDDAIALNAIRLGAQDYLTKDDLNASRLRRSVHHALERSRLLQQVQELVERNSDAMVVVDANGIVRHVNAAAEALFERDAQAMVGEAFGFEATADETQLLKIKTLSGVRHAEMRSVPFRWEGDSAILASLRDITDRLRSEHLERQLMQANRLASIGQLASGVAHEVNNPLTVLVANADFIEEECLEVETLTRSFIDGENTEELGEEILKRVAQCRAMVDENREGLGRISSVIRQLGTFSHLEHDALESVQLNDVVKSTCQLISAEARHQIHLVTELGELPAIVADRGKLNQVVTNLLVNALHAVENVPKEDAYVRLRTGTAGDAIWLEVSDSGAGVDPSIRPRIFDPFFTTKKRERGTGLGLALSAEIARHHGGSLALVDGSDGGACFRLTLPRESSLRPSSPPQRIPIPVALPSTPRRILLVDDEAAVLRAMTRLLRFHKTTAVQGGVEAIEAISTGEFDAIVCDITMPDVDGLAVYEHVKQHKPQLLDRIIFCSGGIASQRVRDFFATCTNPRIDKPVSLPILMQLIEGVIQPKPQAPTSPPDES